MCSYYEKNIFIFYNIIIITNIGDAVESSKYFRRDNIFFIIL